MTMGIFCCHHTPEGKKITVYDDTEKLRGEINTFDIVIIDSDLVPVEILDLAE